ncbi:MAG: glycoside hydrolase family 38 C-terminal domain-containing protein [Candidatus Methanomethylicia archaeon]
MSLHEVERRFFDLLASTFMYFRSIDYWGFNGGEIVLPFSCRVSPDTVLRFSCDFDFEKSMGLSWLFRFDISGCGLVYVDGCVYHGVDDEHKLIPIRNSFRRMLLEVTSRRSFGENPSMFTFYSSSLAGVLWDEFNFALSLMDLLNYVQRNSEIIPLLSSMAECIKLSPSILQIYAMARSLYGHDLIGGLREYRRLRWDYSYIASVYGDRVLDGTLNDLPMPSISEVRNTINEIKCILDKLDVNVGVVGSVFLFGHAHIDTAWLWPYSETKRKIVRTFSTITRLSNLGYDFTYVQSGAQNYRWLEECDPKLFEDVKKLINDGKWLPVGGMWVESDTQLVCGESLARQFLYGQRYFMDKFGFKCRVGWLPDTFGFSAQLPQLMVKSGLEVFVTHKVMWNDTNKFPYHAFIWEGIDGSNIIVHILPLTYNGLLTVNEIHDLWDRYIGKELAPAVHSYGYGDGGGGPTFTMFERVKLLKKIPWIPKLIEAPKQDEYIKVLKDSSSNFPKWFGEIYNEFHRGVFTTNIRIKDLMWKVENEVLWAETLYTIANLVVKLNYPRDELNNAWEVILRAQFHDVLPGSCNYEAYKEAYNELENTIEKLKLLSNNALKSIFTTSQINDNINNVIVFNKLNWGWKALVKLPKKSFKLPSGEVILTQEFDDGYYALIKVPSLGYIILEECNEIVNSNVNDNIVKAFKAEDGIVLENEYLMVKIGFDCSIKSIYDKELNREFLASPSNIIKVHLCKPGRFDAWDIDESTIKDSGLPLNVFESPKILASGPIIASVGYSLRYGRSIVKQEVRLYCGSRLIEFRTIVDWIDRGYLLKAWFNLNIDSNEAYFEVPFGVVKRSTIKSNSFEKAMFEVPALRWMDLSDGKYGFAIISQSRHGYSVEGSRIGLSLLKSSIMPNPWSDTGLNEFTYYIYPHYGDYRSGEVYKRAYEVWNNVKTLTFNGNVDMSRINSFFEIYGGILESIKLSEDNSSIILRIYEIEGREGKINLKLPLKFNIYETDIIEESRRLIAERIDSISLDIRPFEIKTLLLSKS